MANVIHEYLIKIRAVGCSYSYTNDYNILLSSDKIILIQNLGSIHEKVSLIDQDTKDTIELHSYENNGYLTLTKLKLFLLFFNYKRYNLKNRISDIELFKIGAKQRISNTDFHFMLPVNRMLYIDNFGVPLKETVYLADSYITQHIHNMIKIHYSEENGLLDKTKILLLLSLFEYKK